MRNGARLGVGGGHKGKGKERTRRIKKKGNREKKEKPNTSRRKRLGPQGSPHLVPVGVGVHKRIRHVGRVVQVLLNKGLDLWRSTGERDDTVSAAAGGGSD